MKKMFFILSIAAMLTACGTYRSFDLNLLTFGMTKREVINTVGRPNRVLAERQTKDGYEEVLEYNNAYNQYFALEFWNDYLTGYQLLYNDITYVPPISPPISYPIYGRPIYIYSNVSNRSGVNSRPNNSNYPNYPNNPNYSNKQSQPSKSVKSAQPNYPTSPSRPGISENPNRPSTPATDRPSEVGRPPTTGTSSGREETQPANTNTSRPSNVSRSSGTSSGSTRESGNSTTTREGSSSTQTTRENTSRGRN